MSKKPTRGGMVQISGMHYIAIDVPVRDGKRFVLSVFSPAHGQVYLAESEEWRSGCGPWKLVAPVEKSTGAGR